MNSASHDSWFSIGVFMFQTAVVSVIWHRHEWVVVTQSLHVANQTRRDAETKQKISSLISVLVYQESLVRTRTKERGEKKKIESSVSRARCLTDLCSRVAFFFYSFFSSFLLAWTVRDSPNVHTARPTVYHWLVRPRRECPPSFEGTRTHAWIAHATDPAILPSLFISISFSFSVLRIWLVARLIGDRLPHHCHAPSSRLMAPTSLWTLVQVAWDFINRTLARIKATAEERKKWEENGEW